MICSPIRGILGELGIMDYALHIVVEKVASSSQEVIKRDTITNYALQCPTSIGELGLGHAEQIALLEKVQNILLAEQSLLLNPGITVCPTCGNTLKKNGYKASKFHAVFSDHTVRIQKHSCSQPACGWHSTPAPDQMTQDTCGKKFPHSIGFSGGSLDLRCNWLRVL